MSMFTYSMVENYIYPLNFSRSEFLASEIALKKNIDNTPISITVEENLLNTAYFLQELRNRLTRHFKRTCYIIITSGYRCLELNREVGSSNRSAHLQGFGVDFKVPGLTTKEVSEFIYEHCSDMYFDQCIDEWGIWTHIGVKRPRTLEARRQFIATSRNSEGDLVYRGTPYLPEQTFT
jgi:zinc D-Ala-D-Ala carboxypeptidase